ncbi:ABC transporter ATP-binding protein [Mycolicibacterium porcinum]|uniref:ABC transporter ATP-binding protein n=1 Tax=Mycolicibacterium porcinum TaxID=39693 RepID=A0ABV3VC13_9MYCO
MNSRSARTPVFSPEQRTRPQPPALVLEDLRVSLHDGTPLLRGVDLEVNAGEGLALLGESGSGKSLTALAVMGLLPKTCTVEGRIETDGLDLRRLTSRQMQSVRGGRIGLVFQDSLSALNPVHRVGAQIGEALRIREGLSRRQAKDRTLELMRQVRIPDAETRYRSYPHQFSGGMRQRVAIAIALAQSPRILIADEPTTALDPTVQLQILHLLKSLQEQLGMGLILITHDLKAAAAIADRVAVMYAGRIVETGSAESVLARPHHPYTAALLRAIPCRSRRAGQLDVLPGGPPELTAGLTGCPFRFRCSDAIEICSTTDPRLTPRASEGACACHVA